MEEEKRLELRLGLPGHFTSNNNGTKRRTFQNSCSSSPPNTQTSPLPNNRVEVAPVVGWPPVRSFRRNLAGISLSTKPPQPPRPGSPEKPREDHEEKKEKQLYVKINMEGVPIGRKVNLSAYNNYQQLSTSVDQLFSGLLAVQMGSSVEGNGEDKTNDVRTKKDSWDLSRQYTLVYEDTEGDRVLVGDVPWEMFMSTVKRLHVLKTSEVSSFSHSRRGKESVPPSS